MGATLLGTGRNITSMDCRQPMLPVSIGLSNRPQIIAPAVQPQGIDPAQTKGRGSAVNTLRVAWTPTPDILPAARGSTTESKHDLQHAVDNSRMTLPSMLSNGDFWDTIDQKDFIDAAKAVVAISPQTRRDARTVAAFANEVSRRQARRFRCSHSSDTAEESGDKL